MTPGDAGFACVLGWPLPLVSSHAVAEFGGCGAGPRRRWCWFCRRHDGHVGALLPAVVDVAVGGVVAALVGPGDG